MKRTFYDNKLDSVNVVPTGRKGEYSVTMYVSVVKVWLKPDGSDEPASAFSDYIDVGVLGAPSQDSTGRWKTNVLFMQKFKLSAGPHTIKVIVQGKPQWGGIDPYLKLIDRMPWDNTKNF